MVRLRAGAGYQNIQYGEGEEKGAKKETNGARSSGHRVQDQNLGENWESQRGRIVKRRDREVPSEMKPLDSTEALTEVAAFASSEPAEEGKGNEKQRKRLI